MTDYRPNVQGINAGAIRNAFSAEKLNEYILANAPEMEGPVSVKQFAHGQSNPTYLLENKKGVRFVMRKKPPGQLISNSAHNVEREYTIISAIGRYNQRPEVKGNRDLEVPVPHVYTLCKDPSVVGSDFYIMSFVEGRIYTDARLGELPKAERAAYWHELVRTETKLGRIDPSTLGLPANFAPPVDFFDRQVKSMGRLARVQAEVADVETGVKLGLMPGFEEVEEYLTKTRPEGAKLIGIAHGDYKMDNVIYHPTEPRIIAILDWELCTIGPPILDFMSCIAPYQAPSWPSQPDADEATLGFQGLDMEEMGLPTREELIKTWCEASGTPYPIPYLNWLAAWGAWKGSVISQGIGARYARRQGSSVDGQRWGEKRFKGIRAAKKWMGLDAMSRVLADTKAHL